MISTTVLPLELWMHVTDILSEDPDDFDSLQSLALTSRSMVPLCHRHFFSTVNLSCNRPQSLAQYIVLINSNPELGRYLKDFTYEIGPSSIPHEECNALLRSLQTHASALQLFTLHSGAGCDWNRIPEETRAVLVSLIELPTIAGINIVSFVNFPIASLARCPSLHSMVLCHVSEDKPTDLTNLSAHSKIPVPRTVHCEHPGGEPPVDFSNVRRAFFIIGQEDCSPYLRILEITVALQTLKIGVLTPNLLSPLLLSQTVPRRVFEIGVRDVRSDPLCGLSCALGHIAGSNVMEELEVRVHISDTQFDPHSLSWVINTLDMQPFWVNLDLELTAPGAFPLLRSVKVVLKWCWDRPPPVVLPRRVLRAEWFHRLLDSASVVFSFSEDHVEDIDVSEW